MEEFSCDPNDASPLNPALQRDSDVVLIAMCPTFVASNLCVLQVTDKCVVFAADLSAPDRHDTTPVCIKYAKHNQKEITAHTEAAATLGRYVAPLLAFAEFPSDHVQCDQYFGCEYSLIGNWSEDAANRAQSIAQNNGGQMFLFTPRYDGSLDTLMDDPHTAKLINLQDVLNDMVEYCRHTTSRELRYFQNDVVPRNILVRLEPPLYHLCDFGNAQVNRAGNGGVVSKSEAAINGVRRRLQELENRVQRTTAQPKRNARGRRRVQN